MLEELHVQGYALIDEAHISFTKGLNILSGETGAGKSLLIGALGLILGEKAETDTVRTGSEEASVTGRIVVNNCPEALAWLAAHEIAADEGEIIIRRVLKSSGRGSVFIQSVPVTRNDLQELSSLLFDLHGQHEHQSLLQVSNHRKILDQYSGLQEETSAFSLRFTELSEKKKQLEELLAAERDRMREIDMLAFAVREIDAARLVDGEEEELNRERKILSQQEKLSALLDELETAVSESRGGALSLLRKARQAMSSIAGIVSELKVQETRMENAFFELEDVWETVRGFRKSMDFSPEKLEKIEERLAFIHKLQKKYGASIRDILSYCEESKKKLASLENWESEKAALEEAIGKLEKQVLLSAIELSRKRKQGASTLEKKITENLSKLGMHKAQFSVLVQTKESENGKPLCGPWGMDAVEFMFCPNAGEPLKPLKSIASGGEISRVMLAIKSVLADSDSIQSLVFDEIDSGIGGEIAVAVGEYLHALSSHKQILCITHLATIAVRADNHIKVSKSLAGERTITRFQTLQGREKVEEIARMLSGDTKGEVSLSHAEEMLKKYDSPEGKLYGESERRGQDKVL